MSTGRFMARTGLQVERYSAARKAAWDQFIGAAKNATFLFFRNYLEYHADRFKDHSLLFYREEQLLGVLPANLNEEHVLVSHGGLTYGGLVLRRECSMREALEVLQSCLEFVHELGIQSMLYKRIPRVYETVPSDEIDYALFLLQATLYRRDCAIVLSQPRPLKFRKGRKSEISKGRQAGVVVVEERNLAPFWTEVLEPRLESRYGVRPVHSLDEMTLLASRFPNHIRHYSAYHGGKIVAGTTIYETESVAHAQYIAVTAAGQNIGALDYLFSQLINLHYSKKMHFDFGICNEQEGRRLNLGLLSWKESFGARSVAHDFYKLQVRDFSRLDVILRDCCAERP